MVYYREEGTDFSFAELGETNEFSSHYECPAEETDTPYTRVMGHSAVYRAFEEVKTTYIQFALQLIRSYEEIKRSAEELDYIYKTIFMFEQYGRLDISCELVHLGLFYEIVVSDPAISVSLPGFTAK